MADVEQLVAQRNRALTWLALVFLVWQGAWLAGDITEFLAYEERSVNAAIDMLVAVSGLVFAGIMYRYWRFSKKVEASPHADTLSDELTAHNEAKAVRFAFMLVLISMAVMLAVTAFIELPGHMVVRILMILAVVSTQLRFVMFERDGEAEVGG